MGISKKHNIEKWFRPEVENTGWDKHLPADTRRALMLKAHSGDVLASARAMQALANVSRDKETMKAAMQDAKYFFKSHQGRWKPVHISHRSLRITPRMARLK